MVAENWRGLGIESKCKFLLGKVGLHSVDRPTVGIGKGLAGRMG